MKIDSKQRAQTYLHDLLKDGSQIPGHCIGDAFAASLWTTGGGKDAKKYPELADALHATMQDFAERSHVPDDGFSLVREENAQTAQAAMEKLVSLSGSGSVQTRSMLNYENVQEALDEGDCFVTQTDKKTGMYHMTYIPSRNSDFFETAMQKLEKLGGIHTILQTIEDGACDTNLIQIKWKNESVQSMPIQQKSRGFLGGLFGRKK